MSKAKKTDYKAQAKAANARVRDERDDHRLTTLAGTAAPTVGAMLAPTAAKYIPGPSQEDLNKMAANKSSPLGSKRVLIPLAAGSGIALLAGNSLPGRIAALLAGGLAGSYLTATQIKLQQVDLNILAMDVPK